MNNISFPEKKKDKETNKNTIVKNEKPEASVLHQPHNPSALQEISRRIDDLIQMVNLLREQGANKNISDTLVSLEQAKESIELV